MNKDFTFLKFVDDRPGHDFRYSINSDKYKQNFGEITKNNLDGDLPELISYYSK